VNRSLGIGYFALAWLAWAGCSAEQGLGCLDDEIQPSASDAPTFDGGATASLRVLLYTYSNGFRHASIPAGIAAIRAFGAANGFSVNVKGSLPDASGSYCANRPDANDASFFTSASLSKYAAIIFLNTTTTPEGVLLDDAGKAAFEAYIRAGGGFVGVHAAADAEYGWAFYHELLGATFLAHGPPVTATLRIEDSAHPATNALPNPWQRYDEWYDFIQNPRPTSHVLINLDETTYPNNPEPMGDHPVAWCKSIGAGRSFYTALGHTSESFRDPLVRQHVLGGILYAAGATSEDCSPSGD